MNNREMIFDIRGKLLTGLISYDEAKRLATPIIEAMNKEAKDIAKKHGRNFRGFSFSSLMR